MAKKSKKRKSSSKKKSGNIFTKLIIIVLVIVFVFFMIAKFRKPDNTVQTTRTVTEQKEIPVKKEVVVVEQAKVNVNGSWMNDYDMSTLSIKDGKYEIFLTGMDRDFPYTGEYKIKDDRITFVSTQDPCKGVKGTYQVSFNDKDIVLKCIEDECNDRKTILLNDWISLNN